MTVPTQTQIDAVHDREILINATIERCAQVAIEIVAAIRALKDKP